MMIDAAIYANGTLLGYILDQVGPIFYDRCDCVGTFSDCSLVLGRQSPLRHYSAEQRLIPDTKPISRSPQCVAHNQTKFLVTKLKGWAFISPLFFGLGPKPCSYNSPLRSYSHTVGMG